MNGGGCGYRYRVGDVAGLSGRPATALGSWSAGGNALAKAGSTAVSTCAQRSGRTACHPRHLAHGRPPLRGACRYAAYRVQARHAGGHGPRPMPVRRVLQERDIHDC